MPPSLDRRDVLAAAILTLIGVGIPLWLAAAAGATGLPTIDDWVYMRGAESLFRNGSIDMPGHTAAAIGQLVLVQPLLWWSGGEPWAFTAFGPSMAAMAIVFTYVLGRRFLGRASATFAVLLLFAFPGFEREAASFMTDVPAYALTALCLWLGTKWLQGEGGRTLLVASLGVGILAVSIREFAVAAPLAVILTAWIRGAPKDRVWMSGLLIVLIVTIAAVLAIASSANRFAPGAPLGSAPLSLAFVGGAFATINLTLLPAIILASRERISRLTSGQFVAASVVSFLVVLSPTGILIGNYWVSNGIGSDLLLAGSRDIVFGGRVWALFEQLAVFSTVLTLAMVFGWATRNVTRAGRTGTARVRAAATILSWHAPLTLFLVLYAAELVAYTPFGPILDRYLFPIVPVATILLLRGSRRPFKAGRGLALSHAAFAGLAVSALLLAANSFAYDAARWREGDAAVSAGYDARTVDAGYEWVGYHASGPAGSNEADFVLPWYYGAISADPPCVVLSNSRLDDSPLKLIRYAYSAYLNYLFFGPEEPLYLYGSTRDGCPTPPFGM